MHPTKTKIKEGTESLNRLITNKNKEEIKNLTIRKSLGPDGNMVKSTLY